MHFYPSLTPHYVNRGLKQPTPPVTAKAAPASPASTVIIAGKIYNVAMNAMGKEFVEIKRGATKLIYVERSKISPSGIFNAEQVYLVPLTAKTRAEFRDEAGKINKIKEKLTNPKRATYDPESAAYLDLERRVLREKELIQGEHTLTSGYASGDFEEMLLKESTSKETRIALGGHMLAGLAGLHKSGYVHGDFKPENCLIFKISEGKYILKLSDFGKAKAIAGKKSEEYIGNTRFAPPEGKLSPKSDVYGAAMSLIRNFEEPLGEEGTPLIEIPPHEKDMPADKELRGIERYVIENKAFLADNPSASTNKNKDMGYLERSNRTFTKMRRRMRMGRLSVAEQDRQTQAMHGYIDALTQKLKTHADPTKQLSEIQATRLGELLKKMTATDPGKRLSAEDASKEYQSIFGG